MAKSKEPTFSESLNLDHYIDIPGKQGIWLLAGNPTRNNWIRVIPLFKKYEKATMTPLKGIKFLPNFMIQSDAKNDYRIGKLLDNLFKLADGKVYEGNINKTFAKKIAPSITISTTVNGNEDFQQKKLNKLVSYYNYIIENIEATYDVKMSEEKELSTSKS